MGATATVWVLGELGSTDGLAHQLEGYLAEEAAMVKEECEAGYTARNATATPAELAVCVETTGPAVKAAAEKTIAEMTPAIVATCVNEGADAFIEAHKKELAMEETTPAVTARLYKMGWFMSAPSSRHSNTFGSITILGGGVAGCALLAVAAGGYVLGVRRQRAAMETQRAAMIDTETPE